MPIFKPFSLVLALFIIFTFYEIKIIHQTDSAIEEDRTRWPLQIHGVDVPFEVELQYHLRDEWSKQLTIRSDHILRNNGRNTVDMDFDDLTAIPDDQWKIPLDPIVYHLYPQAVNLSDTVNRLLQKEAIFKSPINSQKFRYLTLGDAVCHPLRPDSLKYDIVVVIRSAVLNFNRRKALRQIYHRVTNNAGSTILGVRLGLIFFLGRLPEENATNHSNSLRLAEEVYSHNDLVIGDFVDSGDNLAEKMHYAFTWAATFCHYSRPTFLFIDDDVPFSTKHLVKLLRHMTTEVRENLFHGLKAENEAVQRSIRSNIGSKVLSKVIAPWPIHPPYLNGVYMLLGFSNLEKITLGMLFTRPLPSEDVWIGMVAARLSIYPSDIRYLIPFYEIINDRMDAEFVDDRLLFE